MWAKSGAPNSEQLSVMYDAREKLREVGNALTPQALMQTQALFAEQVAHAPGRDLLLERDCSYGPHERCRLDVFAPIGVSAAPLLLFVHGGGFARGDKKAPASPYFDNVAYCFAGRGFVAATMTYRLAPDHVWPSGGEDVGRAVDWLAENGERFGANRDRLFVMGTSAGATHAATCLARRLSAQNLAGAILMSGIYEPSDPAIAPHCSVYFGDAPAAEASMVAALAAQATPLLLTRAEFDPPEFRLQTEGLAAASGATLLELVGHNHFSGALHLNGPDTWFADEIERFVDRPPTP